MYFNLFTIISKWQFLHDRQRDLNQTGLEQKTWGHISEICRGHLWSKNVTFKVDRPTYTTSNIQSSNVVWFWRDKFRTGW